MALIADATTPLLVNSSLESETPDSRDSNSWLSKVVQSPLADRASIGLGAVGLTVTSYFIRDLLLDVARTCFDAEMQTQKAFNQCNEPFITKLIIQHLAIGFSGIFLGYGVQGRLIQQVSRASNGSFINSLVKTLKFSILYLQRQYLYESVLLTFYLYNGIGIPVGDEKAFHAFLVCSAVAIGIASAFLGIYFRKQVHNFFSPEGNEVTANNFVLMKFVKERGVELVVGLLGMLLLISQSVPTMQFPLGVREITDEIGMMMCIIPIGTIAHFAISFTPLSANSSLKKVFSFHNFIVLSGYLSFFLSKRKAFSLLGMGLIGFAQGINSELRCAIQPLGSIEQFSSARCDRQCSIPGHFIWDEWKAIALVVFGIVLAKYRFLDCKGPPDPLNFTCPIGLETSVYVAGNQVVIDSLGVEVALFSGLMHYYLRKVSRLASQHFSKPCISFYASLSDRIHYLLLSTIPYSVYRSTVYVPEVDDRYALNPWFPMLSFCLAFANYKDALNQKKEMDPAE